MFILFINLEQQHPFPTQRSTHNSPCETDRKQRKWRSVTAQLAMASSIARLASGYRSLAMASGIARLARVQGLLAMASWIARLASDEAIFAVASCVARLRRAMNRHVTGLRKSSPKIPIFTRFNPKFDRNIYIKVNLSSVISFYIKFYSFSSI